MRAQGDGYIYGIAYLSAELFRIDPLSNAPDTRYPDTYNGVFSFGSVAYDYRIGKYEVTAGQYTEFLNAVAKTDTYGLYNTNMSDTSYGSGITRSGSGSWQPLHLLGGVGLRQPSGELRELLGRLPVRQLAAQRPADGAQGAGTTETGAYTLTARRHDRQHGRPQRQLEVGGDQRG